MDRNPLPFPSYPLHVNLESSIKTAFHDAVANNVSSRGFEVPRILFERNRTVLVDQKERGTECIP